MTVLPGWKGDLTDRGQGIDVLPQLFKLFSWTEYATIFLLLFTLEKFSEFNSSSQLTNGCQLLRICCKVISITSSSLPAEKKYIKHLDMSPLMSTRTHVVIFYPAYILWQFLVGVYFGWLSKILLNSYIQQLHICVTFLCNQNWTFQCKHSCWRGVISGAPSTNIFRQVSTPSTKP